MGLRLKFNLVLLLVFALGLGVTGYISYALLHRNAPVRLQSITLRHSARVSSSVALPTAVPALFTRMSSRP